MSLIRVSGLTCLAVGLCLGAVPEADAAPVATLRIRQLSGPSGSSALFTYTTGSNSASTGGFVTIGDFTVNGNGSGTESSLVSLANQTSFSVRNTSTGAAVLQIELEVTGYTLPTGNPLPVTPSLSSDFFNPGPGGPIANNASFFGKLISGVTTTTGTLSLIGPGFVPGSLVNAPRNTATFTLVSTMTLTLAAGGEASLTGTVVVRSGPAEVIPEPGTIALALSALPVLGGAYLRRRMKTTT